MSDITPEPTADERLAEITTRNRRLRNVPFETHGEGHDHGPSCPACELVRGVDDVEWLLAENKRLREDHGDEWAVQWWETRIKSILIGSLTEADARSFWAEKGGCLLTRPRCNPTGDWRQVDIKQQPESGGDPR